MESRTIFLTGGTGFLGGALARQFLESGYTVRMLVRQAAQVPAEPGVEIVRGDLSDAGRLTEQIQGCPIVAHAAAMVATWSRDPREYYRVNLDGFRNMLAASREAGVQTFLYTSTFFALGPVSLPGAGEESGLSDISRHPYQHSKLLARKEARQALREGCPIIILYPGVIYGPGRKTEGNFVVKLISDFMAGRVPGLLGQGTQVWSYTFVEDVARGHLLALAKRPTGGEYVLGGENVSLHDFFRVLEQLTGRPAPRLKIPIPLARVAGAFEVAWAYLSGRLPQMTPATVAMMAENWACDSSKAQRELGYTFRSLEPGLRETLQWMGIPVVGR